MDKKLKINTKGIFIEADLDSMYVILGEPIQKNQDSKELNIMVSEESKRHTIMSYTTELETLKLIFQNMTLRSSSLTNTNLNDTMEKSRVDVSQFAGSRFIACFCHNDQEKVPFWNLYGKKIKKNKVLLQFENFAVDLDKYLWTDYVFVNDGKKCFFQSNDYWEYLKKSLSQTEETAIDDEYDIRTCIDTLQVFDVKYVPVDSPTFSEANSGPMTINFDKVSGNKNELIQIKGFNPTVLGKEKSNAWDYEEETRIMCNLHNQMFSEWNYIDLRLKPEFFRNLKIILSPWDEGELSSIISDIIERSSLPQDIKESITISDSGLKGTLNFED